MTTKVTLSDIHLELQVVPARLPDVIGEAQKAIEAAESAIRAFNKVSRDTETLLKTLDKEKKSSQKTAE